MSDSEHTPLPLDVEALRTRARVLEARRLNGAAIVNAAADEIERLRAEIGKLRTAVVTADPRYEEHRELAGLRAQLALAEAVVDIAAEVDVCATMSEHSPEALLVDEGMVDLLRDAVKRYRSHQQEGQP